MVFAEFLDIEERLDDAVNNLQKYQHTLQLFELRLKEELRKTTIRIDRETNSQIKSEWEFFLEGLEKAYELLIEEQTRANTEISMNS